MLPNTLSTVIVAVTFGIPLAIFAEGRARASSASACLRPTASLGVARSGDGHATPIQNNWIELIWPAIMVAVLMLCFTFLGDGLRDALDPRTGSSVQGEFPVWRGDAAADTIGRLTWGCSSIGRAQHWQC